MVTDGQTDRPNTVTLAAHARRGLKIETQTTNHSSQLEKSWWVEVGGVLSAFQEKSRGIHMTTI